MSAPEGMDRQARMHRLAEVAKEEFRSYLSAAIYIWILLGMFTLHEEIALRTRGGISLALPFAPHGFALVNALVLGKVALVVEALRPGARIKPHPLICPILIESLVLAVFFIAMHLLEGIVAGWLHGEALAASVPVVGGGGPAGAAFAVVGFFVAMIPFCAFRQITLAIGRDRMHALLFGTPPARGD